MATKTPLPATAVSGQILTAAYVNDLRGAFRVLQIVTATANSEVTNTTTTYTSTGLTATITPSSTSSKIFVMYSLQGCQKSVDNAANALGIRLDRNGVNVHQAANQFLRTVTLLEMRSSFSANFMDSPASISALTYTVQFANATNASTVKVQDGNTNTVSTIALFEISA